MINTQDIKSRFQGFRVFGDVHGEFDDFMEVVNDAMSNNLFLIGLGDYVDRGPNSPAVMEKVVDLMNDGHMTGIIGNHDDKLWRHLNGNKVKINWGLETTLDQLNNNPRGDEIAKKWHAHMPTMPVFFNIEKFSFAHGAFHSRMLNVRGLPYKDKSGWGKVISQAFYGQVDGFREDGLPIRVHNWVDDIPYGHTVCVGHEVVSEIEPVMKRGSKGGVAIFMDTGAGKGGKLSFRDYIFD